jgi:NAD(P)-dependent dehydrogenase (short-subunit alcohol dehydrogenase family)
MTMMEENLAAYAAGRVAGKVAIVTGAGQVDGPGVGTGRATSVLLARHGGRVVLVDHAADRAEATLAEIEHEGGQAVVFAGDVTNAQDCERMTQIAVDEFGGLDILINNVGVSVPGSVVDQTEDAWARMLAINLTSAFLVSKYAVPAIADRGGGSIVNVSSIGAIRSIGMVGYSSAKGGVLALTQSMAGQHGPQGVRVNAIVPGSIQTPHVLGAIDRMGKNVQETEDLAAAVIPLGRTRRGTGWDVGYAALFLASDESSWMTGQILTLDGGQSVTVPIVAVHALEGERAR